MFSYFIGCKSGPGGGNPLLGGLDPCRGHQTECGGMQILPMFVLSGILVRIIAFLVFFLVSVFELVRGKFHKPGRSRHPLRKMLPSFLMCTVLGVNLAVHPRQNSF